VEIEISENSLTAITPRGKRVLWPSEKIRWLFKKGKKEGKATNKSGREIVAGNSCHGE